MASTNLIITLLLIDYTLGNSNCWHVFAPQILQNKSYCYNFFFFYVAWPQIFL